MGVVHIALDGQRGANERPVYRPLRAAWPVYNVVWWNSYDFAIRLAYLLVGNRGRRKLHNIRSRIEMIRAREVRDAEESIAVKGFLAGIRGVNGYATWLAAAGSSVLFPPAAPFAAAGFVGCFTLSFCSGCYGAYLQSRKEPSYMEDWRQFSKALEEKVPELRGFASSSPNAA